MKFGISSGAIWRVSYPVIVAGIGHTVLEATDVAFLAHYGVVEAGAVALADAIYEVLMLAILGLVDGIQVLLARRVGRDSAAGVGAVFDQGAKLLLLSSLLVILLVRLAGSAVLGILVASDAVRAATNVFLQTVALGLVFEAGNLLLGVFYLAMGRTRVLMVSTGVLAATNVVLDYGLVFGNLGLPRMGIEGSAIGTVVAEAASFAVLAGYAVARGDVRTWRLIPRWGWDPALTRRIVAISTPAALQSLVETLRWFLFFLIVERQGEFALACSSLVYSCYALLLVPLDGIGEAVCTLVSGLIGQGRASRIRALLRRSTSLGFLITAPLAVATTLAPELLLSVLTDDTALVDGCAPALRVVALTLLLVAPGEMLFAAVVGTGDTRGAFVIQLVHGLAILAWCWAAATVPQQAQAVIWLFLPLGWLLRILLAGGRLRGDVWRTLEV